jgi:hypothetical protein
MNGQAGVGEEGPRELLAGADAVDAACGCVGDIGEVVAADLPGTSLLAAGTLARRRDAALHRGPMPALRLLERIGAEGRT